MTNKRDPKDRRFAIAVVVLIAVALLFLSGCAYLVAPNRLSPVSPPAVTAHATLMPLPAYGQ